MKVNEDNCTVHVEDVVLIKEFYVYRTKKNFNTKDIMRFGAFNFENMFFRILHFGAFSINVNTLIFQKKKI
jgi:hypothetical protein